MITWHYHFCTSLVRQVAFYCCLNLYYVNMALKHKIFRARSLYNGKVGFMSSIRNLLRLPDLTHSRFTRVRSVQFQTALTKRG
jgi:hypothetical protein